MMQFDFIPDDTLELQLEPRGETSVIRHIVMWNVRGDTPKEKAANIQRLRRSFYSLQGRIPGLLALEIGVDVSRIDYACDVVLYSEFESQTALEAYAWHPEHLRVKQEIGDLRIARHQVDYRVLESKEDMLSGEHRA